MYMYVNVCIYKQLSRVESPNTLMVDTAVIDSVILNNY